MKWIALALVIVAAGLTAHRAHGASSASFPARSCAGAVSWKVAMHSVGKTITLRGKVTSAHYALWRSRKGSMTFLDFGNRYPIPNRFTVVVWSKDVSALEGATVCARGTVDSYEGLPEMQQVSSIRVVAP